MSMLQDGKWVDTEPNLQSPTRADYLNGLVSFAEYYRAIAQESGISFKNSSMLPRIKRALANGDEHLNTIRLSDWDALSIGAKHATSPAFKAHGDWWSIAGGVCVAKQAAIDAAMEE